MIFLASDHAGFQLKNDIISALKASNIPCEDLGPHQYDEQDDYPDLHYSGCPKSWREAIRKPGGCYRRIRSGRGYCSQQSPGRAGSAFLWWPKRNYFLVENT